MSSCRQPPLAARTHARWWQGRRGRCRWCMAAAAAGRTAPRSEGEVCQLVGRVLPPQIRVTRCHLPRGGGGAHGWATHVHMHAYVGVLQLRYKRLQYTRLDGREGALSLPAPTIAPHSTCA